MSEPVTSTAFAEHLDKLNRERNRTRLFQVEWYHRGLTIDKLQRRIASARRVAKARYHTIRELKAQLAASAVPSPVPAETPESVLLCSSCKAVVREPVTGDPRRWCSVCGDRWQPEERERLRWVRPAPSASARHTLEELIGEMRMIGCVAGQASVEGPQDSKSLMAAAEAERALRWAEAIDAVLTVLREGKP